MVYLDPLYSRGIPHILISYGKYDTLSTQISTYLVPPQSKYVFEWPMKKYMLYENMLYGMNMLKYEKYVVWNECD